MSKHITINVIPIISTDDGMPMVELQSTVFGKPLQLNHAEAFELGHMLIEVTATSINDAMMFGFITADLGIPNEEAAKMLQAFRAYRGRMLSAGDQDKPGKEKDNE